jgi:hypothetical protein
VDRTPCALQNEQLQARSGVSCGLVASSTTTCGISDGTPPCVLVKWRRPQITILFTGAYGLRTIARPSERCLWHQSR